jgi:hypothetical protein
MYGTNTHGYVIVSKYYGRMPKLGLYMKVQQADPRSVIQEGEAKLDEIMITNLGLVKSAIPYDTFAKLTVHKDRSTVATWIKMRRFFYLIGCIQSPMLVDCCHYYPTKLLKFLPGSFALYLYYHLGTARNPLLQPGCSSQPMLDIPRNLISIVGGSWDSLASCYKTHAAVQNGVP